MEAAREGNDVVQLLVENGMFITDVLGVGPVGLCVSRVYTLKELF